MQHKFWGVKCGTSFLKFEVKYKLTRLEEEPKYDGPICMNMNF
jgi:hypothetical protein